MAHKTTKIDNHRLKSTHEPTPIYEYGSESLTKEFKSDRPNLKMQKIYDAIVALTNTEGGTLYLGVEDDGTPSGVQKEHLDTIRLGAMISQNTVPPVPARVEQIGSPQTPVIKISVPKATTVVATKTGKILHRMTKFDGSPESVPLYPYEIATRLSDLGKLDYSAQPVIHSTVDDFDPTEIDRLRQIITNYQSGDRTLLELTDEELEKALRLVTTVDGKSIPTLTGLLLVGKETSLQQLVPTNGAAFQVLDGTNIAVNVSYHGPLLKTIQDIIQRFKPWNPGTELNIGLFSELVPVFDERAFREALINAFGHRDYSMLGRVRIQLDHSGLTISNPGGFIEGITIRNLLTAEPRGRNPCLMNALKRTGLAESTGRGIDRIFEGSLHYGRPLPDYSQSTSSNVRVFIARSAPDIAFVRMVTDEQQRSGRLLSLNSLLVLDRLKTERRCSYDFLVSSLDIGSQQLETVLGQLVETGLIERISSTGHGTYILGKNVYRNTGKEAEYVRQTDIDRLRYQELIVKLMQTQSTVTVKDIMNLLHIDHNQAYYQLSKLVKAGKATKKGEGRSNLYSLTATSQFKDASSRDPA